MPSTACQDPGANLPERYVLGELDDEKRAAFEEHYFDCPACAEQVTAAVAVAEGARALPPVRARTLEIVTPLPARSQPARIARPVRPRGLSRVISPWPARVAGSFASVLAAVVAAQSLVVLPRLRHELELRDRPHAVAAWTLHPQTRGEPARLLLTAEERSFTLAVEVGPGSHQVRLLGPADPGTGALAGQATQAWFAVPAPRVGEPLQVMFPSPALPPGRYLLEVMTAASTGVNRKGFPFVLEITPAEKAGKKDRTPL